MLSLGQRRMLGIDLHCTASRLAFAACCPWPFVTGCLVPAGGHWFPPQRTGHPRKKLTCLLAGCPGSSALNPKMFLSLILAQAGMWLPRPVAKELFWGLLLEEGLDPPHCLPQARPAGHPWPWRLSKLPPDLLPSAKGGWGVIQQAQGLNLTVPKLESIAESRRSCPWPRLPSPVGPGISLFPTLPALSPGWLFWALTPHTCNFCTLCVGGERQWGATLESYSVP